MGDGPVPTYDEWRRYCFTHGYADFWRDDDDSDVRFEQFARISPSTLLGYMTRCFEEAGSLGADFTAPQIGDGVNFLFGCASEFFLTIRESGLPPASVAKCYRAVATLYRDCFDHLCCRGGTDPDGDYINFRSVEDGVCDRLDGAVYMIWDSDTIDVAISFPDEYPELFEASVDVLREVLKHCRTSTGKISALHGVGHLQDHRPKIAARLVDEFLKRPGQPEFVVEYAKRAREGGVQ
jgi:hypothetical protein